MADHHEIWFEHYDKNNQRVWRNVNTTQLKQRLSRVLEEYTRLEFDHIEVAMLGNQTAVFVTKGPQATVLYDKTKRFPSAKLLAALVLLGSK
jgi:hypothetical protein